MWAYGDLPLSPTSGLFSEQSFFNNSFGHPPLHPPSIFVHPRAQGALWMRARWKEGRSTFARRHTPGLFVFLKTNYSCARAGRVPSDGDECEESLAFNNGIEWEVSDLSPDCYKRLLREANTSSKELLEQKPQPSPLAQAGFTAGGPPVVCSEGTNTAALLNPSFGCGLM